MPPQVPAQSPYGKVIAPVFKRRAIVVDEGPSEHRHHGVIAQASLYYSLVYRDRPDMPHLPALIDIEFAEAARAVGPVFKPLLRLRDIERSLCNVSLHTRLPSDTRPAFAVCAVQMPV